MYQLACVQALGCGGEEEEERELAPMSYEFEWFKPRIILSFCLELNRLYFGSITILLNQTGTGSCFIVTCYILSCQFLGPKIRVRKQ